MLFPLPLTPFERYYLTDDNPEYPTTIPAELGFTGRLQRGPFTAALRQAVARHPLLGAMVEDGPGGPQWVAYRQTDPWLDWDEESAPIGHADGEYLDLRRNPGLRVWVRLGSGQSGVLLQFHHACCDGLAVLQFIGDLLVLYAAEVGDAEAAPRLPEVAVERLRDRGMVDTGGAGKPSLAIALRDAWVTLRVWQNILFRSCAVLAAAERRRDPRVPADGADDARHVTPTIGARDFLPFETHQLTIGETEQYKRAAARQGVTINDLLLRDMLLAIHDWNRAHGESRVGPCRVNVPVYVRGRSGFDIPASNGIGFGFVTVDPDRFGDRQALLAAVHQQMEQVKNWKLALYFLGGLAVAAKFKRIMRWALARKRPLTTVVLSHLGRAFARLPLPRRDDGRLVCGDVVLELAAGVPPVRPLTRASGVVLEYAGRLTVALRCDTRFFAPQDTRALLASYVEKLTQTAGDEASQPTTIH